MTRLLESTSIEDLALIVSYHAQFGSLYSRDLQKRIPRQRCTIMDLRIWIPWEQYTQELRRIFSAIGMLGE